MKAEDMNIENEQQTVVNVLNRFATVLTSSNIKKLPGFFSEDAVFMPNETTTISGQALQQPSGNFFDKSEFKITFSIKGIVVDLPYAFVQATATATIIARSTGEASEKTTRDFFVLRKTEKEWKIYRYIFNTIN
jgi:ketosteroid isomerase-like protein